MTTRYQITDEQLTIMYLKYGFVFRGRETGQSRTAYEEFRRIGQLPFPIITEWYHHTETLVNNPNIDWLSYAICSFADRVNNLMWALFDKNQAVASSHGAMVMLSIREILHDAGLEGDQKIIIESLEYLNVLMATYETDDWKPTPRT